MPRNSFHVSAQSSGAQRHANVLGLVPRAVAKSSGPGRALGAPDSGPPVPLGVPSATVDTVIRDQGVETEIQVNDSLTLSGDLTQNGDKDGFRVIRASPPPTWLHTYSLITEGDAVIFAAWRSDL